MALDPAISLGVKTPDPSSAANPLSTLGAFASIQNQLNQNRLFQQTFAARQTAGQILANAPDMDSGLAQLMKNPLTAPFAPEIGNSIRQYESTTADVQGKIQDQSSTGLQAVLKGAMAGLGNPEMLIPAVTSSLATLSPQARARVQPAVNDLLTSLTQGLPQDPAAAAMQYRQRLYGLGISAGITPEALSGIVGSPTTRDVGGSIVSGVQGSPLFGGGGFTSANAVGKSLAPQVVSGTGAEGQPTSVIVGGGASAPMGPGGLAAVNSELHGVPAPPGSLGAIQNELSVPSPGQTVLEGPTKTRGAEMEALGKSAGDIQTDMVADAKALPGAVKRIDLMSSALQQFQAGGGADARTSLGKALQALKNAGVSGITDKMVNDVANSSLPATQIFNAEVKPLVIGELKNAAQGTGRVMRSEVDAFINMMNSTTDPRALTPLLNQARYALQVGYDQSQRWPEFKQGVESGGIKGYDLGDYYGWYNKQLNPKGLPSRTPGGLQLGPVGGAKGAGTGKPTLRYVPGRGLVPVSGGQ